MSRTSITSLIFILFIAVAACGQDPVAARLELSKKKINYSTEEFVERAAEADDPSVVVLFLAAGMDPNARDHEGYTALMASALNGRIETIKLLLKKGADVNTKSKKGETALMLAAEKGNSEAVKILLRSGADPNCSREDGATALSLAAKQGHNEIVQLLQSAGAQK